MKNRPDNAPAERLKPPDHLSDASKLLWLGLVPRRARSAGRLALLTVALEARDRAEAARQTIAAEGMTSTAKKGRLRHVHPWLRVEKDAMTLFARCWHDLGLGWDMQIDRAEGLEKWP